MLNFAIVKLFYAEWRLKKGNSETFTYNEEGEKINSADDYQKGNRYEKYYFINRGNFALSNASIR